MTFLAALFVATALDKYVAAPDAVFAWKVVNTVAAPAHKTYVIELTSQSWRSAADVDRPVWKHWLTVTRPARVSSKTAMLFIGGGSNLDPAPVQSPERSVRFAVETGTVVADLGMVPNQPLHFSDSMDVARFEDDLIAYSRVKHFSTKDDTWLVRLAMVKSGARNGYAAGLGAVGGVCPRSFRGLGRLEARLDDMAGRRRGSACVGDHPGCDRRAE